MIVNHIKDALNSSPLLEKLRKQLASGGGRTEIESLLSAAQKSEIHSIYCFKGCYIIKLKSAYALYGIKDALRNFHHPTKVVVFRG